MSEEDDPFRGMDELAFTRKVIVPLFKEMGFKDVRYNHSPLEHGCDLTCYYEDPMGNRQNVAAQIKVDDIGGTDMVQKIANQAISAFTNPQPDTVSGSWQEMSEFYVITSGNYTADARQQITNRLIAANITGKHMHFYDKQNICAQMNCNLNASKWSKWEAYMNELGLIDLLSSPEFKTKLNNILEFLFSDENKTPILAFVELPTLLNGVDEIREALSSLESEHKTWVLHWFSLLIIIPAYYNYGKKGVFMI